ncbi:MAG: Ig-like domain-containing protein [Planctomycetes bacterium]|nr:Ig-like domain-containing protein [Planctomycetota bacterium]
MAGRWRRSVALALLGAGAFVACDQGRRGAVGLDFSIRPPAASVAVGQAVQLRAVATHPGGEQVELGERVHWSSSTPAVATVGPEGWVTGVAVGGALVSATDRATRAVRSVWVTVTPAVLVSLAVTPSGPQIALGTQQAFTAVGTFSDSTTQDLTAAVTWSSSAVGVAVVSNAGGSEGLAASVGTGTTTITAVHPGSGVSGGTTLTVFDRVGLRASSSAGASSGVLSLVVSTPSGTAAGDVLLAAVAVRPASVSVTAPAGWTQIRRSNNNATNANALLLFRRLATAGEPGSHTFTLSASTGSVAGIAAFRFVDAADPVDVEAAQTTASGLTHTAPSVTSTGGGGMLVTAHAFASAATWTPPAGMTECVDVASDALGAAGISLSMHVLDWPTASATGARAAVASNDVDAGNAAAVVLRRAP